jgi:hypothetical protein
VSRPEFLRELREARPLAPAELREHVRRIAAEAAPAPRRPWHRPGRRALLVLAAAAVAAAAAAAVLVGTGSRRPQPGPVALAPGAPEASQLNGRGTSTFRSAVAGAASGLATVPAPSPGRVQRIRTTLELRVASAQAVSDDSKAVVQIARALGGYASRLVVAATGRTGYADITLRIPKQRLAQAVARLSALGTILAENVSIQDLQTQVDATAREIYRLAAQLDAWERQPQTAVTQRHVAALAAEIDALKRGRAATIRTASDATIAVALTSRPAPAPARHRAGPLHGLVVAFRWLGIGAVYLLALGTPLVVLGGLVWLAARAVRRHREASLLSRS